VAAGVVAANVNLAGNETPTVSGSKTYTGRCFGGASTIKGTLMTEAVSTPETSAISTRLQGAVSQKTITFMLVAEKT
jgi:hypothetical protein